jgi:hypothetical protein
MAFEQKKLILLQLRACIWRAARNSAIQQILK